MKPLGPHRQAAVDERRGEGRCCICDRPIPPRKAGRTGKYTCGLPECTHEWRKLCWQDLGHHAKEAREAIERATEALGEDA